MRALDRSMLLFIIIYAVAMIILMGIGERRPDVYVSVSILIYFIYILLDSSIRENTSLRVLNIFLFIVFVLIMTYRVLAILGIKVI